MSEIKSGMEKMATPARLELIGKIAFVVGVIFAIVGGIWGGKAEPTNDGIVAILLIAGLLIGLLNVTAKEAPVVLSATVALVILAIWGNTAYVTDSGFGGAFGPVYNLSQGLAENVVGIVDAFALLMAPAAVLVALRAVIAAAKPGD